MDGGRGRCLVSSPPTPRSHTRATPWGKQSNKTEGAGASLVLAETLLQGPGRVCTSWGIYSMP